ncbi:DnaJ domain [Trypanosoma vivax]|uniref:Chaperone protein DNAJ, putatative n=1 Tax=Trypanosoma vivax (strain Y486) TaxID=1055687 RepID=G0U7D0_TRYVY|nr:chaperone protein DNAJ, putatative [Trypanosoma vivax]KAH8620611.1 DnaJ domain [Trypanosoma vivax]CCC51788.1 chaperone protein DNAJ, putatative [Trypanosoma vivax Y486]
MGIDYYKVLGIPRNASLSDIKKAYHQLALKYHPDKATSNREEAERRFKEVSEAYDVLSDDSKKKIYDAYGEEGLKMGEAGGGNPAGGMGAQGTFRDGRSYVFSNDDAFKVFKEFFGNQDPFAGGDAFGGGGPGLHRLFRNFGGPHGFMSGFDSFQASPAQEVPPLEYTFACTLEDIYTGCKKKFVVSRMLPTGEDKKEFCVDVLPGYKKGTKIRFPGEGGISQGYPPNVFADLVFVLGERPHPRFERDGADVRTTIRINLKQALLGTTLSVKCLDGGFVPLQLTGVSNNGRRLVVNGKGFPDRKNGGYGNMIVIIEVEMPTSLSDETRRLIEKCNF